MSHQFHPTVLREYDIRGVIGETLGTADAYAIGRGFATLLRQAGGTKVAVGYDGRISSPELEQALVAGLNASGVDVVRIGMGPTPMLYYAEASAKDVHGGIQITGSHNPANYNGFKMVFQGRPFFGPDILELGRLAASGAWLDGDGGYERREVLTPYVARLVEGLAGIDRAQLSRLRIGWDAGNGAAGPALERLVEQLPGEHHLLFTQVDGNFPNHHPDPTEEKNLAQDGARSRDYCGCEGLSRPVRSCRKARWTAHHVEDRTQSDQIQNERDCRAAGRGNERPCLLRAPVLRL